MGTFSTVAPTNVVGWSEEVSGEIVSMYNKGKYGYAYYSKCAVTRLSDNSICVRIEMYSNGIMGWGAANKAAYIPWGNNGTENEFGPSEAYNYGSGFYLAATYCIPENHALDAWFKRAFGDEGDKKTPFALE